MRSAGERLVNALGDEDSSQISGTVLIESISGAFIPMIILVPLIFIFQWLVLRRYKKKLSKLNAHKTFS
jgi:hypothetical protein